MQVLEYVDLDTSRVADAYRKVLAAIERDDFRSADIKKLTGHARLYRARLDYANRLLLTFVRQAERTYALALEVIEQHDYGKSRFLRGAVIDENKIPDIAPTEATHEAAPIRYVNAQRRQIQYLDKPLSFDDTQDAIYTLAPPLILVGSAGSGKTALALEKLKHAKGEVLYVTHSAYLAQNARNLYFACGYEREHQEATFLSYRELLETLRVPPGREVNWRDFAEWFARQRQSFKDIDAHQAFEEIRGVITAQAEGILSRERYLDLGVRRSIFLGVDRERIYELYERYVRWLREAQRYDVGILAQEWRTLAKPQYDFIIVDEVQDLTPAQLALILGLLKQPDAFLLCGDSNQIVHPNFFSWSQIKTLFWRDAELAARQEIRVLRANFRNSAESTRVANALLRIKHRRFGSIDRESNFLVDAVGAETGAVTLLADRDAVKKTMNERTRASTRFAVLVLRDEDKVEARRHFQTPLVFAVHECKGLEYDSIVLYRFVSNERAEFSEIAAGVEATDLDAGDLEYRRARDKGDKSGEIYKFYVNALYVALTRAIRDVFVIESDLEHPLLRLLGLKPAGEQVQVEAHKSSLEDWQREARKLELQGKQEQAEAIRQDILRTATVPWTVCTEAQLRETLVRVFRDQVPGNKPRQLLHEFAACYAEQYLAHSLAERANFGAAHHFDKQLDTIGRKHYTAYFGRNFKSILQQCEQYGIEHRTAMNQTPLMAAAAAGNLPLIEALLDRGADPDAADDFGHNALHWALSRAFRDPEYARSALPAIYERIAPARIDLMAGERLVRIDRNMSEYFILQTFWTLFRSSFGALDGFGAAGLTTRLILAAWQSIPAGVLRAERNRRQHLSGVLARNEVERSYAYNRQLFLRVGTGRYQLSPALSVRRRRDGEEQWVPILTALNMPLLHELQPIDAWPAIRTLWSRTGAPDLPPPILWERAWQDMQAQEAAIRERVRAAELAAEERQRTASAKPASESSPTDEPKYRWGTKEARAYELAKLARRIEENRNRGGRDADEREE